MKQYVNECLKSEIQKYQEEITKKDQETMELLKTRADEYESKALKMKNHYENIIASLHEELEFRDRILQNQNVTGDHMSVDQQAEKRPLIEEKSCVVEINKDSSLEQKTSAQNHQQVIYDQTEFKAILALN
ncbi:hypothetical protein RF11_10423 [Thelohanellus kitauei]|uniref:Uncharacterized protein n=1 Tax=Thelohanellus kitauei TaxID=669202 RepID=A0A0C2NFL7_THEKT|nr:hypothetical protein RF11_10423 [Thelohanellus kitauei]